MSRERDRRHGGAARRARRRRLPAPAAQQLLRHRADRGGGRGLRGAGRARAGAGPSCWPRRAGTSAPASTSPATPARTSPRSTGRALRLFAAPLPVVAAVQGAAIGGGCGLALSADFRVATPQSRFSANFARLGFHHGFALTVTLPAVVGRQAAADLLLTGRRVGGEEALALGLCDRLAGEGRPAGAGPRLRGRAGRVGPAGRPLHPGHAARRPGGGGPARHGARVRRADPAARHRRLRRGRARRGGAPRPLVPAERRHAGAGRPRAQHVASPGTITPGRSAPSPRRRPASTTRTGSSCWRTRSDGAEVDALIAAIDPFEERRGRASARAGGRALLHRPRRRDHLHHPPGAAVAGVAGVHALGAARRRLCRPHRARRAALLGPGGLQEAGHRVAVPLAPGQRVRLRGAAAVPDLLGGAHRRHRGERVPVGGAGAAPARHAGPRVLRHRLRLPARPGGRGGGAGAGRQHRGVLVA